jgi:hypothetical protein
MATLIWEAHRLHRAEIDALVESGTKDLLGGNPERGLEALLKATMLPGGENCTSHLTETLIPFLRSSRGREAELTASLLREGGVSRVLEAELPALVSLAASRKGREAEHAMELLESAAAQAGLREEMVKSGVIPCAVRWLGTAADSATSTSADEPLVRSTEAGTTTSTDESRVGTATAAAHLLARLCYHHVGDVIEVGGVATLVDNLDRPGVGGWAAQALGVVASRAEMRPMVIDAGPIPRLGGLLQGRDADKAVQLVTQLAFDERGRAMMAESGVIELLVARLKASTPPLDSSLPVNALIRFCSEAHHQDLMVAAGAIPPLVKLLGQATTWNVVGVSRILREMSRRSDLIVQLIEAGAIPATVRAVWTEVHATPGTSAGITKSLSELFSDLERASGLSLERQCGFIIRAALVREMTRAATMEQVLAQAHNLSYSPSWPEGLETWLPITHREVQRFQFTSGWVAFAENRERRWSLLQWRTAVVEHRA